MLRNASIIYLAWFCQHTPQHTGLLPCFPLAQQNRHKFSSILWSRQMGPWSFVLHNESALNLASFCYHNKWASHLCFLLHNAFAAHFARFCYETFLARASGRCCTTLPQQIQLHFVMTRQKRKLLRIFCCYTTNPQQLWLLSVAKHFNTRASSLFFCCTTDPQHI